MRIILIACAAALLALGCDNKDATPPAPPKQAEAKPSTDLPRPPIAIAPSEAKEEDDDLPTQEDFTEEAEKDISAANVESEVDKLEKEIGE